MKSSKKGFTLAEVLLTLAIVGIVAALTIPALLNSTNQAELKTGAKKALSALNQAALMATSQDGTDFTSVKNQTAMVDALKGKFNAIASDNATNFTITSADGMLYTVKQVPGAGCEAASTAVANPASATSCVITVDVNGANKGTGSYSTGSGATCTFTDKYDYVLRNAVVLAGANATYASGADCGTQAMIK